MSILPTVSEIRNYIQDELQCPSEFIRHLHHCGVFLQYKSAMRVKSEQDIVSEILEDYGDFCVIAQLNPTDDNRKAKTAVFLK